MIEEKNESKDDGAIVDDTEYTNSNNNNNNNRCSGSSNNERKKATFENIIAENQFKNVNLLMIVTKNLQKKWENLKYAYSGP